MFKLSLIVFFNVILIPLYLATFILCFLLTFIPLFPVITARKNIRERLQITGFKNRFFITLVFQNYVYYLVEMLFFDFIRLTQASMPKNFVLVDFLKEVREVFPEATAKGFSYLAGHVGNLESHNLCIVKANKSLNNKQTVIGLAKPSKFKMLNTVLTWHRVRKGVGMIWTDKSILKNMSKAIDNGDSICLITDQKPKKKGVFIRFFGEYAPFPTTGVKFCAEKKSIFIYVFSQRILPGWVKVIHECGKNLHLNQKILPHSQDRYVNTNHLIPGEIFPDELNAEQDKNTCLEMAYFSNWLENNIKKVPTQWSWDYRKWSREPKPK